MRDVIIYHNPRCSKSRQTMELLISKGIEPDIRLYLEDPPTRDELIDVLAKLNLSARELLRTSEDEYSEHGLDNMALSEDQLLDAMLETPKLIQRPIVIVDEKAAIGRPPEQVLDIL